MGGKERAGRREGKGSGGGKEGERGKSVAPNLRRLATPPRLPEGCQHSSTSNLSSSSVIVSNIM